MAAGLSPAGPGVPPAAGPPVRVSATSTGTAKTRQIADA
jgi:hypothetical protein